MRVFVVLCCAVWLSGCSGTGQLSLDDSKTLDPTKVYLNDFESVTTTPREADQYACLAETPLVCSTRAISMECHCGY